MQTEQASSQAIFKKQEDTNQQQKQALRFIELKFRALAEDYRLLKLADERRRHEVETLIKAVFADEIPRLEASGERPVTLGKRQVSHSSQAGRSNDPEMAENIQSLRRVSTRQRTRPSTAALSSSLISLSGEKRSAPK